MDNITFRSAPEPAQPKPELPTPEPNNEKIVSGESDREPIELREEGDRSVVLDALNIDDRLSTLPDTDKENVSEVKKYVLDLMKSKGLGETVSAFKKTLENVKDEMGLDTEAEPSIVLDRIAGVVKAWRNIAFIKDPEERRTIFMKLSQMKSSKDMNREVYKLMEQSKVWR